MGARKMKAEVKVINPATSLHQFCINCGSLFEDDFDPISKVVVSFLPATCEAGEEYVKSTIVEDEDEEVTSVTILDALVSIFSGSNLMKLKKSFQDNDNVQLTMCFRCAQALSTFYQSFIELLTSSAPSAYICQIIPRIELWHTRVTSDRNLQDGKRPNENPFALFVEAVMESNLEYDKTKTDVKSTFSKVSRTSKRQLDIISTGHTNSSTKIPSSSRLSFGNRKSLDKVSSRRSVRIVNQKRKQLKLKRETDNRCSRVKFPCREEAKPEPDSVPVEAEIQPRISDSQNDIEDEISGEPSSPPTLPAMPKRPNEAKVVKRRGPHPKVKCSVDGCKKEFLYHWLMNNHVQLDHEKKEPFKCEKCGFRTFDIEVFKAHFCKEVNGATINGEDNFDDRHRYYCGFCNHPHPSMSAMIQHARTHDRSIIKCSFPNCDKTFLRMSHLAKHERFFHGAEPDAELPEEGLPKEIVPEPTQCAECGKVFASKSTYRIHLEIHSSERKYLCNLCGMSFKQRRALTRHNLVHKDLDTINVHQCQICHKRFKRRYNLTQHYHSRVHPPSIIEKLLKGEKLNGDDLKNSSLTIPGPRVIKQKSSNPGKLKNESFVMLSMSTEPHLEGREEIDLEIVTVTDGHPGGDEAPQYNPIYVTSAVTWNSESDGELLKTTPHSTFRILTEMKTAEVELISCDDSGGHEQYIQQFPSEGTTYLLPNF